MTDPRHDRIGELYRGELAASSSQRIARDRIHWMCAQCRGAKILDVGCSQGIVALLLGREGFSVEGIDSFPAAIESAEQSLTHEPDLVKSRVSFFEQDLYALQASESYDTVILGEVIEHQCTPERFFTTALQLLNDGGRLVLTTPYGLHPHPDHKVEIFPSQLLEYSRDILAIDTLDVVDGYIRLAGTKADPDAVKAANDAIAANLLRLTENASLAAQQGLYQDNERKGKLLAKSQTQLDARNEKLLELKKSHDAARSQNRKQLESLQLKHKSLQLKHESLQARHTAAIKSAKQRQRQLDMTAGRSGQEVQLLRESISFRLGHSLVNSVKSWRGFVALPVNLVKVLRIAILRPNKMSGAAQESVIKNNSARPFSASELAGFESEIKRYADEHEVDASHRFTSSFISELTPRSQALVWLKAGAVWRESSHLDVSQYCVKQALSVDHSDRTLRDVARAAFDYSAVPLARQALNTLENQLGKLEGSDVVLASNIRGNTIDRYRAMIPAMQIPSGSERASRQNKVAYFLHNTLPYRSGGYATRSHGLALSIKRAGYDVAIFSRAGYPLDDHELKGKVDSPAPFDEIDGLVYQRTLEFSRSGLTQFDYTEQAADAYEAHLRRIQPGVVQAASNYLTALPALIAARRLGLPFVYEVRGFWEITRASRDPAFKRTPHYEIMAELEALVANAADSVFTLTAGMKEELIKRNVPAHKIALVPNSVDTDQFRPLRSNRELAAKLSIPDNMPVIGYIGSFVEYEGLDDLVEAGAILRDQNCVFKMLLVGDGAAFESVKSRVSELGMQNHVILTGRVPHREVASYYSLMDVCPFPRKPLEVCEIVSPLKPFEALSMEKAVLVSSTAALVEIIDDGNTGLVFSKGSVPALADKLKLLVEDGELRKRLGTNGRKWVCKERDWQYAGEICVAHYAELRTSALDPAVLAVNVN